MISFYYTLKICIFRLEQSYKYFSVAALQEKNLTHSKAFLQLSDRLRRTYTSYCPIYLKNLLANIKRSSTTIDMILYHRLNNLHIQTILMA